MPAIGFSVFRQGAMRTKELRKSISIGIAALGFLQQPNIATASSAPYDSFAESYDKMDGGSIADVLGLNDLRSKAGEQVSGDVLEIAIGTGLQSQYYDFGKIRSFNGIDSSQGMLKLAKERIDGRIASLASDKPSSYVGIKTNLAVADATDLSRFQSDSFDTVIDTFSFCVFNEPNKVMEELKRVVRPGGTVVLLENSVSTQPLLKLIQDFTEPIVTPLSKDCRWNVNIPKIAENSGLELIKKEEIQQGTILYGIYSK